MSNVSFILYGESSCEANLRI